MRAMGVTFAYARLAVAGLLRHPLRTFLTCLAVALAVCLFVAVLGLQRGYAASLGRSLEMMGYHVLVTARGCPYETATLVLRGGNIPMYVDESLVDVLREDPAWEAGTRFLMQGIEAGPERRFTVFLGVDDELRRLKPWMRLQQGSWFSHPEAAEAILGYNAAEVLRLKPGDSIEIPGLGRSLAVRGVLERTGSQDDGMVLLPLVFAQSLFNRQGKLTGIGVKLSDLSLMGPFLDRAFEIPSMQAVTVAQLRGAVLDLLGAARALMLFGSLVAVIIAGLGVFNAVLVSVTERRRQLAVFKVLGASPAQVMAVVCSETLLLGIIGGFAGALLAWGSGQVSDAFVMRLLPYAPPPAAGHLIAVGLDHAAAGIVGAVAVAVGAGLGPAVGASLRSPATALRDVL
ncbi:MAG: ABC transporter permease [Candidatus Polarisedimenticolia bacterium]